jgi:pimeloyl-ACP methyl ester carboxylesterase
MDYLITARRVRGGQFVAEPDRIRYLKVDPTASDYTPNNIVSSGRDWAAEVIGLADGDANPFSTSIAGDILVFVHGYNNDRGVILERMRRLSHDLREEGWRGVVIAFDWPSDSKTLNYWEDRSDAAATAIELVRRCVKLIAAGQAKDCRTNIHLLGHSTGAYVITEAFAQSENDGDLFKSDWRIGQVAFIAGDIAGKSLSTSETWSAPMFKRIMRLTNYSNPYDSVLAVSNAKRLGVRPRAGRTGLPADHHAKAVNVDCGPYFVGLDPKASWYRGSWTHSWHIGNRVFARDLAMTLEGAIDRAAIPTRAQGLNGLILRDEPRPPYMADWQIKAGVPEERGSSA